jgi:hypothetical protein
VPELKIEQLLLIAGFILPGAISMYVYGRKVPQKEFELKDRIAEAICFSLMNFLIVWLPVRQALASGMAQSYPGISWIVLILSFVVVPVAWPFAVLSLLQKAEKHGWIAVRARTAWDDFFGRQQTEWLQVELTDGRVIGDRFGRKSFTSSWPDPGHLFIEEIWRVDKDGYFVDPLPGGAGILLRPADYKLVRATRGFQPMNRRLPLVAEKRSDPRLIIEKGGYSLDRGGSTRPPVRRPAFTQDGCRPMTGGPTIPPTKPTPPPASGSGTK